jgi:hypothetical protein
MTSLSACLCRHKRSRPTDTSIRDCRRAMIQTTVRLPKSNVAVCESVMFALLFLSTRMPPAEVTRAACRDPASSAPCRACTQSPTILLPYHEGAPAARVMSGQMHRRRPGPYCSRGIWGRRVRRVALSCGSSRDFDEADVPSIPSRITRSRARTRCGVLRRCMPTCTTRLCFRAAASMVSPSTTSTLIGF